MTTEFFDIVKLHDITMKGNEREKRTATEKMRLSQAAFRVHTMKV